MQDAPNLEALPSPLEHLLTLLTGYFPYRDDCEPIKSIDEFQRLQSQYQRAVYDSSIFFLARRLITLACHAASESAADDLQSVILNTITSVFDLSRIDQPENLVMAVYECFHASAKKPNKRLIQSKIKEWLETGKCCYICGSNLVPKSQPTPKDAIEVEHLLPRSLGAGNEESALRPSCHQCNSFKGDRIGASDLHFESLAYKFSVGSSHESDYHRFAASFFNRGRCGICGKSGEVAGQLKLRLREPIDSWHLFNISLTCIECESL